MSSNASGPKRQAYNPFVHYGEATKCLDCRPAALKLSGPVLRVIEGGRNDDVTALRLRLMRNGYLPIPLYGKEPPIYGTNNQRKGLAGWQNLKAVSRKQIEMYEKQWPDAGNTGGLTRDMPVIDIDIMHPEAAGKLEELAREHFEERGRILVRIGLAPKRAIPLRTNAPFKKMVRIFAAPDGSTQKIEILGDGQQLVLYGIHPDMRQPYRWHGGEPSEVARHELPSVGGDDMEKFIDEATTLLVEEFGFKLKDEKRSKGKKDRAAPTNTGEFDAYAAIAPCGERETAWAKTALERNCEELRDTGEGDRNNKLYRCAFRLGTMVARDWIAREDVESALFEAAANYIKTHRNGERKAKATIQSGIEDGLECPHEDLSAEGTSGETSKTEEKKKEEKTPFIITVGPYDFPAEETIEQRDFIYGRHLLRATVSITAAVGGAGKSSKSIIEALAMATGKNLFGVHPMVARRVLLINLEDNRKEMDRRIAAAMKHYKLTRRDVGDRLFVIAKGELKLKLAKMSKGNIQCDEEAIQGVIAYLKKKEIDVVSIDPLRKTHGLKENDNVEMGVVIECFEDISENANCAVHLWHHNRKSGSGETSIESLRGASSLVDAPRSAEIMETMTEVMADKLDIDENKRKRYFRTFNGKSNFSPPIGESNWFELQSVILNNNPFGLGDDMGVVVKWEPPEAVPLLTPDTIAAIKIAVAKGEWREYATAATWVGKAIASVLKLDADSKGVKGALKELLATGVLKTEQRKDQQRKTRMYVVVAPG
jgi:hypothetical protein